MLQRQVLVNTKGYPMILQQGQSYLPLPDYWLALLHKRLMGQRVLRAVSSATSVRVYAHCAAHATGVPNGAVALAVLNIGSAATTLSFGSSSGSSSNAEQARTEYVLTAGEKAQPSYPNALQSKQVKLNGKLLQMSGDVLPPLDGKVIAAGGTPFVMPPTSYGFIILPDAKAMACM